MLGQNHNKRSRLLIAGVNKLQAVQTNFLIRLSFFFFKNHPLQGKKIFWTVMLNPCSRTKSFLADERIRKRTHGLVLPSWTLTVNVKKKNRTRKKESKIESFHPSLNPKCPGIPYKLLAAILIGPVHNGSVGVARSGKRSVLSTVSWARAQRRADFFPPAEPYHSRL